MKFTVDLVFWNPETISVCVEAANVEEAIKTAYEVGWEGGEGEGFETMRGQECIYDCCTDTKVGAIARGRHYCAFDAPLGAHCNVPPEHQDPMWEPFKPGVNDWKQAQIERLQREITEDIMRRMKAAA